jgi:hypothetical protein
MKRLSWEPPRSTPSHVDKNVPADQRTLVPLRQRTRYVPPRRQLRFGLQFDRPPHRPPRSDQGTLIKLEPIVTTPLQAANATALPPDPSRAPASTAAELHHAAVRHDVVLSSMPPPDNEAIAGDYVEAVGDTDADGDGEGEGGVGLGESDGDGESDGAGDAESDGDGAVDGESESVGVAGSDGAGVGDSGGDAGADGDAESDGGREGGGDGDEDGDSDGDGWLGVTVHRKLTEPVAPDGEVAVTVTSYVPAAVDEIVPVISPPLLIDKPGGKPDAANCGDCPSAALSDVTCNWIAVPAAFRSLPGSSRRTAAWRK